LSPSPTTKKTGFLKGVLQLSGGSVVAQVVSVIGTLIASRLFSPEVFGLAAVFSSIAFILSTIICLRYELAIVLPEKDEDGINVLFLSIGLALLLTIVLTIIFGIFNNSISDLFNLNEIESIIWLIPALALLNGIINPLRYWFTRSEDFAVNGKRRIITQVGVSSFVVTGGGVGFNAAIDLILLRLIGSFGGILYYLIKFVKMFKKLFYSNISILKMIEVAIRFKRFPIYSIPDVLLSTTSFYAPVLILTSFFGAGVVGRYNHAVVLIGMPIELIATAVSQVYYQKISSMKQEGVEFLTFTENVYSNIIKLATYPAIAIGFIAPAVVSLVIGHVWYEAGVYVAILIPFMLMKFIAIPIMNIYLVNERQDAGLIFTIIQFVIQISALLIGALQGSPKIAILSYSLSGTILYFIFCLWLLKTIGASYFRSIFLFGKSFIISLPFILILSFTAYYWEMDLLIMSIVISITMLLYFILLARYDKYIYHQIAVVFEKIKHRNN